MPYTIQVVRDDSASTPGFFARVAELPGCMTQGGSFAELGDMIEDAMRAWIEAAQEDGQSIPEPFAVDAYSGKFVTRVPRSLHRQLVEAAEREGVSLNAFVNVALARAVGIQPAEHPRAGDYAVSHGRYVQVAESGDMTGQA